MYEIQIALAAASITVLLTEATLTERMRTWLFNNQHAIGKVLDCPFCTSWWVCGLLAVLTGGVHFDLLIRIPALVCLTMAGVYVIIKGIDSTYSQE